MSADRQPPRPSPSGPAPGRLDLLSGGDPAADQAAGEEAVGHRRAVDGEWRGDFRAGSRHSRLDRHHRVPRAVDEDQAAVFAADLTRQLLGDLAPALLLLPAAEARRARALAAYAYTLLQLARGPGIDGEKLALLNRWEFALETVLNEPGASAGGPAIADADAQPVFVAMAAAHRLRPWPEEALDRLTAAARLEITDPTRPPAGSDELPGDPRDRLLAGALAHALLGEPNHTAATLGRLLLSVYGWPDGAPEKAGEAVERAERLAVLDLRPFPGRYRRAASYLRRAARHRLAAGAASSGLGLTRRLTLLAAAMLRPR